MKWYLVAVKPQQHKTARIHLTHQGVDVYDPEIQLSDGKQLRTEHAFPAYIFTRFDPLVQSAVAINSTRGVNKIVMFGQCLAIVNPKIIDIMREQFKTVIDDSLQKGDRVIIKSGPFAGMSGIFHETNKKNRCTLLYQLIGKTQKIEIDLDMVERA